MRAYGFNVAVDLFMDDSHPYGDVVSLTELVCEPTDTRKLKRVPACFMTSHHQALVTSEPGQ